MFGAQENHLFVRPIHFHAVGLDGGIILERIVNDAAVKGIERFEFDDIAPTAHFSAASRF